MLARAALMALAGACGALAAAEPALRSEVFGPAPRMRIQAGEGPTLGDPGAPVAIVEFSDFRCPHCRAYFRDAFDRIRTEYVEAGRVVYRFRDAGMAGNHGGAAQPAAAARCAGEQGRFWEMHRALFTSRVAAGAAEIRRLARDIALDAADFDACLADGSYDHALRRDTAFARSIGVTATPSFLIGRSMADGSIEGYFVIGAPSFARMRQMIETVGRSSR